MPLNFKAVNLWGTIEGPMNILRLTVKVLEFKIIVKILLEMRGIDPRTSHMLSERSTI